MDRRQFLQTLGATGAVVAGSSLLNACGKKPSADPMAETRAEDMTLRTNPNTGDRVSLLGYGMMRLPMSNEKEGIIDQEEVNRLVDYALAHGVNYYDTSPVYCQGHSEEATGTALARHPRGSYYIATKMSNFSAGLWKREESQQLFERSLRYLQTDYIDYLLLHSIGGEGKDANGRRLSSKETFEARFMDNGILDWLVEQKQEGRIRNLGFSYHGDIRIFDMLLRWHDEGRYHWDFVQIELNYMDWLLANEINPRNTDADYLYHELAKRGIPAVIMEPLLGGRLSKVPEHDVVKMKQMRPDKSVASWAFRFAGTPEHVLSVLSGMTYMEHLEDNLRTYSPLEPVTEKEHEFLMQVAQDIYNLKPIPCTACNYCMPCPYGIDIPALFHHYNTMVNEGNLPYNSQSPEYRRQRRAYLVGYDESVPRLRQADHCIGCGHCVTHCPQGIDIPREIRKLDRLVENLRRNGKAPLVE